jgi:V/A-type H+-transporting ATPase subunit A
MELSPPTGRVVRVNGPAVHLTGLTGARFDYVEVGEQHLPGEIITVEPDHVVAQLYEYSGGLRVGAPAWAGGHPLRVELGPGLLGGIYDGLLRPLQTVEEFVPPRGLGRITETTLEFEPLVEPGAKAEPGDAVGRIRGSEHDLDHLVLVPPGLTGPVDWIAAAGVYRTTATVATVAGTDLSPTQSWPIRHPRPYRRRNPERVPFQTGQRVLDMLSPLAQGSSATVIGGFGEGKTILLEQVAKWGDADVIIYVGCGERGNELSDLIDELTELIDPRTGQRLMRRTIILANTSNMPVMAREASIYTAATLAEFYRDMGHRAVIIADSTSRWAEAQRELASRTGAIPAEEGYPADLPASLAAFYQRAGRVTTNGGRDGTVTIITSVSPPGGDITEPVAAHTQRFVQAVWALDRDLAYARHYPAVSWQRSFTRDGKPVAAWHAAHQDPDWDVRRSRLRALLAEADRLRGIADLVGLTALPAEERILLVTGRLISEVVLQQSALNANDTTCAPGKQAALGDAVLAVHDAAAELCRSGVPASLVEEFDFGPLIRAKEAVGPDDAAGVSEIVGRLLSNLKDLRP